MNEYAYFHLCICIQMFMHKHYTTDNRKYNLFPYKYTSG